MHPFFQQLAHLPQGSEEVGVKHFAAERAVETLHAGILRGFAGLNPVQHSALRFAPLAQRGADEFGAVVAAQLGGPAVLLDQLRQQAHDPPRWQGEIDFDAEHLPVKVVDDVEGAEGPSYSSQGVKLL